MNYTYGVSSNRGKKIVDRGKALELDNILVWEVTSDVSREYLISLQGYSEETGMNRVMVSDGKREGTVIGRYQRLGFRISCCSAACRMTIAEQEGYKKVLNDEDYESCIEKLFSLENCLNDRYGYRMRGKSNKKTKFK